MSLANHFPSSPLSGPVLRSGSSPADQQDAAREAAEAIPPVPNWDELSLEEIYNQLIISGDWKRGLINGRNGIKQTGDVINELLKKLVEKKYLEKTDKSLVLAKTKKEQKDQRELFADMVQSTSSQVEPKTFVVTFLRESLKFATGRALVSITLSPRTI